MKINKGRVMRGVLGAISIAMLAAALQSSSAMATTFTVTTTADSGAGSLRQAISNANADATATAVAPHRIEFNIAGGGVQTITPLTLLPAITRPVVIDATTQPGSSCGSLVPTLPAVTNTPHTLMIEINAASLTTGSILQIGSSAGGSVVKGLIMDGYNTAGGYYIRLDAKTNVNCNYIGVSSDGATTPINAKASGIMFTSTADDSLISGNLITVNGDGMYPAGSSTDRITNLTIADNLIGTTASGFGTVMSGTVEVKLTRGIYTNWLDTAAIRHNIIANASGVGIWFFGTRTSYIRGNYIGVGIDGKTKIATTGGISGNGSEDSIIGGPNIEDRNVVGGLTGTAINWYTGGTNAPITIQNNYIGVAADGVTPINNSAVGIQVSAANGTTILDNTIVNNTNGGVSINNINNVKLQGNYIGTTAAGTVMRNGKYGVWIGGTSSGTLVGGTGVGQKNVISGHNLVTSDIGVQITGTTTNTTVQGNYIGVGPDGVTRMPNGNGIGVQGSSTNVTIGGSSSAARNIVSGNQNNGIIINGATTGSSGIAVQGNYIGLDKNGNAVTGATGYGITFTSPNGVLIGGAAAGEGNVISGNPAIGLYFAGNNFGQNVNIYGNTIGLKPDNETTAPNGTGISTGAMSTPLGSIQIGGASAGQGNIISGNTANGITLANFQSSAFPMSIKGNRIGQSISGVAKPNGTGIGFYNTTRGVLVGGVGPGEGNIIANNTGVGVSIASSPTISNITVRGNSIYLNGSLGIDLSGNNGSPDVWDITDADTGSNGLQNFARRTTFTKCNGTTTETRTVIRSTANTTFDVDFYANPSGRDVSGYGEGEQYISSTTVTTDSNGYVALTPPAATNLSMTATDPSGNTSEFSNERTASVGSCTVTNKTTNDTTPSLAGTLSATNTTPTLKVTVDGQTVNATVSGTSWTLADNTLSALADGTYDVTTTYTDPETTMTTSYTKVGALTVDSTVPTASITRKSGQASYTQTNSAWFTLTLSEAAATGTLTAADIAPGTTTGTVTTFTKIDDTHYEFEITGMTSGNTATPSIAAGKFTDVNGNANTTSTGDANNWVLYDTTAPNLFAVNVDITGSYSLNSPRITWSTTDDQSGIDHYTISYDGGSFSTVTSPQTPTLAAASSHTVTVRAYDKAGNVREKTIQYPPVVVITAPTTLSKNAITDTSIEVQGPVGMVINTVTISGAGSSGFTCDTLPGTVTIRCTGGQIMSTGTLTVTATSDGGVTTDNSQAYVIDTVNPSVTINQKSGQADPTNVNSATYRVVFSENINPATFTASDLSVAGTSGAITSFTKIDDRTWEVEITGMTSGDTAQLTLAASKVQDPAGNDNTVSTSTDNSVTYDNVKPTITINKKSGQADPTNVNSATFTVISSEALTSLDASDFTTSNTTGSVTTVTAINATTWEVTITGMTSGDNATLTMTAGATTDLAGNDNIASTSTDNFVAYDSVAPTIGVTAQATNNTSPQIKGTVNDSTATIMVTVNGQDYPATNNGDGTWMLASGAISPALGEATYDVVAKATDAAGNNGTDATLDELVIDTTSPTGTIDTLDPGISNAPQLTGTVNDPSATILVTANGNTYTAANHGDGTWMLAAGAISPALVPGDYTATVVFKDAATNTSNVQTTITVLRGDADVPTVSSVNWIGGTPKITGTYDQANSQSLRVRVNGLWYRLGTDPQLTVNGNAWTLDLTNIQPPLAAGSYDVTVEITTRSGATIADTSTAELKVLAPNPANIIGNLLAPHSGVTLLKTAIPLLLIPVVIISAITTLYVSRRIYLYYR